MKILLFALLSTSLLADPVDDLEEYLQRMRERSDEYWGVEDGDDWMPIDFENYVWRIP